MRNNRLHLTFSAEAMVCTPNGYKESYRTKTMDSAKKILGKRNTYSICRAVFKDGQGVETVLIDKPGRVETFKDVTKYEQ